MTRTERQDRRSGTRDEIVRVGTELIGRQGFNHTGLDAVLKAAGVPKGSFYHYFPSKEDFGLAVIDEFATEYGETLDRFLGNRTLAPLARLRALFDDSLATHGAQGCGRGCLIGNLGQEMASQHERFRERLDLVFKTWERRFALTLGEAKHAGQLAGEIDVDQLAKFILAGWEGAILRSKVTRSVQPLRDFVDVLFTRILNWETKVHA